MRILIVFLSLVLGSSWSVSHAEVVIKGALVTMKWVEPTTNGGLPLNDLAHTFGTSQFPGEEETNCNGIQAASTNAGGQEQQVSCTLPIEEGVEVTVSFRAYAVDESGNVSLPSETKEKTFDFLAPDPPTL